MLYFLLYKLLNMFRGTMCTYQPVLTALLQPQLIPTRGENTNQSSGPDDGHIVARNMLSNL